MTQPFTTRAEAEALQGLDPAIIERMARDGYEAMKAPGSSLPPWDAVVPTYKAAFRREVLAIIAAGVAAGEIILRGEA